MEDQMWLERGLGQKEGIPTSS